MRLSVLQPNAVPPGVCHGNATRSYELLMPRHGASRREESAGYARRERRQRRVRVTPEVRVARQWRG